MTETSKRFTVFFSWQSDGPGKIHTNGVRSALKRAAVRVDELYDVNTVIDEATRGVGGAVNIPDTLAGKIKSCDVFVADVTTVHRSDDGKRTAPNPNVAYELGLAVAHVGWSRVILLTNTNYGALSDLPFDFDRHRASTFAIVSKDDKNGQAQLSTLVEKALGAILEENAKRPRELEGLSQDEVRRNRDIENLRWLMSQVSMSAIDGLIERLPDSMMMSGPMMYDAFDDVYKSSSFHVYDLELQKLLVRVHSDWKNCVSYPQHFREASNPRLQIFGQANSPFTPNQERDKRSIIASRDRLVKGWGSLVSYIRDNYIEIDLDETSKTASERYSRGWDE